jgi:RNA polymerase sigma factor for flagellar operon FliA
MDLPGLLVHPDTVMAREERIEELIATHQGLLRSVVTKLLPHAPPGLDLDDVKAYAQQGLIQAADRFDPDRGVSFTTFAYYRIRGAVIDGFREMGPVVNPKAVFHSRADEYIEHRAAEARPRSAADAAQRLADMVADLAMVYLVSTEELDTLPDEGLPDPLDACERREEMSAVKRSIAALPENERELIHLMYFKGLSPNDTAARMGISKSWVSRLHAKALATLREAHRVPPGPRGSDESSHTTPGAIKV